CAEALEALRVTQEVDDLHQLCAHLLDAGDVAPGHLRLRAMVGRRRTNTRHHPNRLEQQPRGEDQDPEERERKPGRGEVGKPMKPVPDHSFHRTTETRPSNGGHWSPVVGDQATRSSCASRAFTPVGLKSPISPTSERSTRLSDVSSRTPHSRSPSARATSSAVAIELFSKSTSTVTRISGGAHSANFDAASTVLPPYDAMSACGTVPIPRPPHHDACSSVVTPISAPVMSPAT